MELNVTKEVKNMAIPHAKPAKVIDISPLGSELSKSQTTTLVKTDSLEVIRLVVPAGKQINRHQVPGEITVQCLEGKVVFTAGDSLCQLTAGKMIYLAGATEHWLQASEDSSLLLTIMLKHKEV